MGGGGKTQTIRTILLAIVSTCFSNACVNQPVSWNSTANSPQGLASSGCQSANTCSSSPTPTLAQKKYNLPAGIGTVFWSGPYNLASTGQDLPSGLSFLASQGFESVKIPFDPASLSTEFGIQGLSYTDTTFLKVAVNSPTVVTALGTPGINNIVLATFDAIVTGTDGSQRNFANPLLLTSRQSDIIQTYEDLALSLFRNYKNSGKTFIITNWETDNSLYCGSAYDFETNYPNYPSQGVNFRDWCLANYGSIYGVPTPQAAFTAMQTWFEDRQKGINLARIQAANEGDVGVTVYSSVEFVAVHMIQDIGYPTALTDIIPQVSPDVLAYSSYESINNRALLTDFPLIQNQSLGHQIIISEFGFSEGAVITVNGVSYSADQMQTFTTQQIMQLENKGSLNMAIAWQAFKDSGASGQFGLMSDSGQNTDLFNSLLAGLGVTP